MYTYGIQLNTEKIGATLEITWVTSAQCSPTHPQLTIQDWLLKQSKHKSKLENAQRLVFHGLVIIVCFLPLHQPIELFIIHALETNF